MKCVPCILGLQMEKTVSRYGDANVLNKQSLTADEGWSSTLGLRRKIYSVKTHSSDIPQVASELISVQYI